MTPKPSSEELARQLEALQQAADELTTELAETGRHLKREIERRVQAEKALRKSQQQYRTLVDNSLVGIYKTDLDGRMLYANQALIDMFGYDSADTFLAEGVISRYRDPADRERLIEDLRASGRVDRAELHLVDKAGRLKTVLLYATLEDEQLAGVIVDITERKRAEENLRASLAYNKILFQESHVPRVVLDPVSGRFTDCNPAAVRIYAYGHRREVIGRTPLDVSAPVQYDGTASAEARAQHLQKALQDGAHRFEWRHQRPDGSLWDAEVYLMTFTHQDRTMLQFSLQDITARKQAQQALADSERRLNDIVEFLPDPTWAIDSDGRVIAWNRAVERLTGVRKEDILGKGDYAHAVPFFGHPRPTLVNLILRRDRKWEAKYFNLKEEDGLLIAGDAFLPRLGEAGRYLSGTAARLFDAQGNVVGAIQSVRDITAAKRTEQERERLIVELQEALAEVRTLSGLLPICAQCKKIRDDRGYWNQIEVYLRDHTDANFSHGVCPDCADDLYPGLDIQFGQTSPKKD
jgi:PAS domain S-box-containing protein